MATFERADASAAPASDLLEAMIVELTPLYGRIDVPQAPSAGPEDFSPPGGSFLGRALVEDAAVKAGGYGWVPLVMVLAGGIVAGTLLRFSARAPWVVRSPDCDRPGRIGSKRIRSGTMRA